MSGASGGPTAPDPEATGRERFDPALALGEPTFQVGDGLVRLLQGEPVLLGLEGQAGEVGGQPVDHPAALVEPGDQLGLARRVGGLALGVAGGLPLLLVELSFEAVGPIGLSLSENVHARETHLASLRVSGRVGFRRLFLR